MTPTAKKIWITVGITAGLAGLGVLAYALYRHNKRLGEGSTLTKSLPEGKEPATVVDRVTQNGMTTTHYYSKRLPIKNRVALVQDMVFKSLKEPETRILAMRIVKGCPERDKVCEAKAINDWVTKNIRYSGDIAPVKHPNGKVEPIDYFATAKRIVQAGGEDCDGKAVLVATLLSMNDIEARLRVTSAKGTDWSHIYVVANLNGKFVAMDTTLPGSQLGMQVPFANKLDYRNVRVSNSDREYPA